VPASASLSIAAVADQVGGVELPDPGALAPGLQAVLGGVVDPRKRVGCGMGWWSCSPRQCARSRPVRDPSSRSPSGLPIYPTSSPLCSGSIGGAPSESTIRRVLGKVDPDRFDAVLGGFVQRLCAQPVVVGRRRVLAVDGKTARGSRHLCSQ
jgi:hypothetical protein